MGEVILTIYVHFITGIFHYQANKGCTTAVFRISFPEPNPGTLPLTSTIATLPAALQSQFFDGLKYTQTQANAVGPFPEDSSCIARCRAANHPSPLPHPDHRRHPPPKGHRKSSPKGHYSLPG